MRNMKCQYLLVNIYGQGYCLSKEGGFGRCRDLDLTCRKKQVKTNNQG